MFIKEYGLQSLNLYRVARSIPAALLIVSSEFIPSLFAVVNIHNMKKILILLVPKGTRFNLRIRSILEIIPTRKASHYY